MRCPKCGNGIKEKLNYCPNCHVLLKKNNINDRKSKLLFLLSELELCESAGILFLSVYFLSFYPLRLIKCVTMNCKSTNILSANPLLLIGLFFLIIIFMVFKRLKKDINILDENEKKDYLLLLIFIGIVLTGMSIYYLMTMD